VAVAFKYQHSSVLTVLIPEKIQIDRLNLSCSIAESRLTGYPVENHGSPGLLGICVPVVAPTQTRFARRACVLLAKQAA
jgi:hypothetical protein